MRTRLLLAVLSVTVVTGAALAATVTFTLESSQQGLTVAPGTPIDWTIKVSVSVGDNVGLALASCDLTQNAGNPELFDITPANGVPSGMGNFSRPAGICNPGETDPNTGYIGVQRGDPGQKNLIQIGGAQNTFGQPGSTMGTSVVVVPGVGQSAPQILASGSFPAPSTDGAYMFSLQNAVANVVQTINSPPDFSPVIAATVDTSGASFSFTVGGPQICRGDASCDGKVDFGDINPFVDAMLCVGNPDPEGCWLAQYPTCPFLNNDINEDLQVTFGDINPFVDLLIGSSLPIMCP